MNNHITDTQRLAAIRYLIASTAERIKANEEILRRAELEAEKRYKCFGDTAHRAIVHGESLLRSVA